MNRQWPALGQQSFGQGFNLRAIEVLAEYNGPQIVLAELDGAHHLGVAADADDSLTRWVFAPVTPLELRALAGGVQRTRESFLKPEVLVIDYDHDDSPVRGWTVNGEDLEDRALPKAHAFLPTGSRQILARLFPSSTKQEIAFEQRSRSSPGIPFKALSQAIDVFQRLWITLAASGEMAARGRYANSIQSQATLSFVEAYAGSLRIHVEPRDRGLFEEVSEEFSQLVAVEGDALRMSEALRRTGPRVLSRYKELLSILQRHELEIMTSGPLTDRPVFLGPERASRILGALLEARHVEEYVVNAEGYFLTYSSVEARFEFSDEESERRFKGDVDDDVRRSNRTITVGEQARYAVIVEVTRTLRPSNEPEETYRLRAAVELNSEELASPE
ncbi:hypothetical protein E5843_02815 [Luteimonas yindakuii]|uniref:hypothetical protein n=1 Tax=Luteimonas yindakuii TaxID=2565782 RepID=UPI0010A585EF|nr:hypothetical protein [Luteimonas yindakuii]QCO66972.1 hypothetical protein E5843_02815 [Luteimonas yindakuii]